MTSHPPPPAGVTDALPAAHRELVAETAQALPDRARHLRSRGGHRAQGRVVRDALVLLGAGRLLHDVPAEALITAAMQAAHRLRELQLPAGVFSGGDNLESPPDSAFTINDLAWAKAVTLPASHGGTPAPETEALLPLLDQILETAVPALVGGGVHTPNHRWEIASALTRLWRVQGDHAARDRALQWLSEGVDLQADGMFSERSANYAAHVSVPSLLALGRMLGREDLVLAADRGLLRQAELTGADGLVETVASRRQDQFERFNGGALHPWFRAHAARTGDRVTARAAARTSGRADADAVLTLLALSMEDPSALAPLPVAAPEPTSENPEVVMLEDSGLVRVDHGSSSAVLFGGTDTAAVGRIASGASSQPVLARLRGSALGVRDLRLSRDFFSMGPLRPGAPRALSEGSDGLPGDPLGFALEERIRAEYFHPLAPADRSAEGRYDLEFNGRFAAAMKFSRRPAEVITLRTSLHAAISPGALELRWEFDGPLTRVCLLLALDGVASYEADSDAAGPDSTVPTLAVDDRGRRVLLPSAADLGAVPAGTMGASTAACTLIGADEHLDIDARGALGGSAFYDPGEAFSVLGATDEPSGDVLLIPASSAEPLTLTLRLHPAPRR